MDNVVYMCLSSMPMSECVIKFALIDKSNSLFTARMSLENRHSFDGGLPSEFTKRGKKNYIDATKSEQLPMREERVEVWGWEWGGAQEAIKSISGVFRLLQRQRCWATCIYLSSGGGGSVVQKKVRNLFFNRPPPPPPPPLPQSLPSRPTAAKPLSVL